MNLQVAKQIDEHWVVVEQSGHVNEELIATFSTLRKAQDWVKIFYPDDQAENENVLIAYITDSLEVSYDY